jgi:glycoside/pentoside/hexuronide:cation symporter, GPH family
MAATINRSPHASTVDALGAHVSSSHFMTAAPDCQRLTFWEKFGYGAGDAACNVVFQMAMTFMAFFYTDVYGLAPAAMGTLFLVVRGLVAVSDIVMGIICDRTETRWGKFRPYLIWMSLPYAVIAVLTFTTPDLSASGKLIYAYVTYSLLLVVYSAINVPYCALGAVLTADPQERVSVNGYRFFLATAGGTLVVSSTLPLVHFFGAGNLQIGFQRAVMLLSVIAVGLFGICFLLTKERVQAATQVSSGIWQDVVLLLKNDQWLVVAALNFILFIALVIQDGAAVYYVTWYVGRPELIGPFLTVGMMSSMIGSLFAELLVSRFSNRAAYAILQCTIVLVSLGLFMVGPRQITLMFAIYGLQQFLTQMASPILWSMMADTTDYGEFISGRRTTGLAFSGMLFFLKTGMAVGGALLGWFLALYDYHPKASAQSPETIHGIALLFTLVPALGHLLLAGLVQLYKLDNKRCREFHAVLEHRRGVDTKGQGRS